MMEPWPGFCGTSYATEASAFSIERTVNWYQESGEVPGLAKGPGPVLLPRPGLAAFGANPATAAMRARGKIVANNPSNNLTQIGYGVSGTSFYAISVNGTQTVLGTVVDDGLPVTMAAGKPTTNFNNGQIAIASGGELYVYSGGVLTQIPINLNGSFFGADYVTWLDGYFIVLQRTLSQFQISALDDATTWSALDVSGTLGQADRIQAIIADKEYLYLVGARRAEIWYNAGTGTGTTFPFTIEPGAFIEDGIGANASLCQSNNSIYWLDQSARGGVSAVRAEGLITRRVSTHALEVAWANQNPDKGKVFATVADCITFSYIWKGHTMIRWIFPTADASYDYDSTESDLKGYPVWTDVTFTDSLGATHACLERDHCYAFGLHIVGSGGADGTPGVLYTYDDSTYYDAPNSGAGFLGFPIVRDRIVRLPWNNGLRQFLDGIELIAQNGTGLDYGQGSAPVFLLRISRDGGKTWGTEYQIPMGAGGKYFTRLRQLALGSYRDGAVWLRCSDPVFAALVGALHAIRPGGS